MYGNVGDWFNELVFGCYDLLYCRQMFQLFWKYLHFRLAVHCNRKTLRNVSNHL